MARVRSSLNSIVRLVPIFSLLLLTSCLNELLGVGGRDPVQTQNLPPVPAEIVQAADDASFALVDFVSTTYDFEGDVKREDTSAIISCTPDFYRSGEQHAFEEDRVIITAGDGSSYEFLHQGNGLFCRVAGQNRFRDCLRYSADGGSYVRTVTDIDDNTCFEGSYAIQPAAAAVDAGGADEPVDTVPADEAVAADDVVAEDGDGTETEAGPSHPSFAVANCECSLAIDLPLDEARCRAVNNALSTTIQGVEMELLGRQECYWELPYSSENVTSAYRASMIIVALPNAEQARQYLAFEEAEIASTLGYCEEDGACTPYVLDAPDETGVLRDLVHVRDLQSDLDFRSVRLIAADNGLHHVVMIQLAHPEISYSDGSGWIDSLRSDMLDCAATRLNLAFER